MYKTVAALMCSLAATGLLWYWSAGQFVNTQTQFRSKVEYVQAHQNDSLHGILCYLEAKALKNPQYSHAEKVQSVHTLRKVLKIGNLQACDNLPVLPGITRPSRHK